MLSIYPACFLKEGKKYAVVFPDLNWLATDGKNESDAMRNAVDCLAGYLYMEEMDGNPLPQASPLSEVSLENVAKEMDADTEGGFVNLVSVDVTEYARANFEKSVKKTLSIPQWLDLAAKKKKINFSQTLQEALIAKVRQ